MTAPIALFEDRCECAYAGDKPPLAPRAVVFEPPFYGSATAHYECPDCGRRWKTGWLFASEEVIEALASIDVPALVAALAGDG